MRILLYNFVQPGEAGAGGVGSYHSSVARGLTGHGHDVITMSSGVAYSAIRPRPHLRFGGAGRRRVVVVNSPVLAPARFTFADPAAFTCSNALDFIPARLHQAFGEIAVFHFQNLEGLTRRFFIELRAPQRPAS